MLRTKESSDPEKLTLVAFQNVGSMFQSGRDRGWVEQGGDAGAAQFRRPKFGQMIERKFDMHGRKF